MNRTDKTTEWQKKLTPENIFLMKKWARESVSKEYKDFKQQKMEIRKANNEKWLHKIERSMKEGIKNKANKREPLC